MATRRARRGSATVSSRYARPPPAQRNAASRVRWVHCSELRTRSSCATRRDPLAPRAHLAGHRRDDCAAIAGARAPCAAKPASPASRDVREPDPMSGSQSRPHPTRPLVLRRAAGHDVLVARPTSRRGGNSPTKIDDCRCSPPPVRSVEPGRWYEADVVASSLDAGTGVEQNAPGRARAVARPLGASADRSRVSSTRTRRSCETVLQRRPGCRAERDRARRGCAPRDRSPGSRSVERAWVCGMV